MAIGTEETNKLDKRKPMQLKGKTVGMHSVHLEEKKQYLHISSSGGKFRIIKIKLNRPIT
jgi:hypothetical protein